MKKLLAPLGAAGRLRVPFLRRGAAVVVVLAVAVYLGSSGVSYLIRQYHLNQREQQSRAAIVRLETEVAQLQALRDYMRSDQFVEQQAREIEGLVRPGDIPVTVQAPPRATGDTTQQGPWWLRYVQP